jgi:hypothetical protein
MPPMGTDPRRLDGLRSDERAAAALVERATGATARAHDVEGRQGAHDVDLTYPDGRTGALEVTTHAGTADRHRRSLMTRARETWRNPGRWWWTLSLPDPTERQRVRAVYARVVERCEALGIPDPASLPASETAAHPEVAWLATASRARLFGHRPADAGRPPPPVTVTVDPSAGGLPTDPRLLGLPAAVGDLLGLPHVARRAAKVGSVEGVDERHLLIGLGPGALPRELYLPLCGAFTTLPTLDPDLPDGLTHLWLTTAWRGAPLFGWNATTGWVAHPGPA